MTAGEVEELRELYTISIADGSPNGRYAYVYSEMNPDWCKDPVEKET